MSALGQKQTCTAIGHVRFTPKSDRESDSRKGHVRFTPRKRRSMRGQVPGVGEVVKSEPTTKCAAYVARLTPFIVQPERYLWRPFRGDNAMNEICSDQNDDEVLQFEVSDVFLELSAGDGRDNTNAVTHGVCTALDFCPGP